MLLVHECSCGHLQLIATSGFHAACQQCGARDRWRSRSRRRAVEDLACAQQLAELELVVSDAR